jgi:hypothetical protein
LNRGMEIPTDKKQATFRQKRCGLRQDGECGRSVMRLRPNG